MLNIVCVNEGDYLGRGEEYVNNLRGGIEKNCTVPHRFIVKTNTGESGWWSKLTLFKPDTFPVGDRILYFDLDTWIVGNIDDLANYDGYFAGLRDFYQPNNLGSGVLAWKAGEFDKIWSKWVAIGKPKLRIGDQAFIYMMIPDAVRLQDKFPNKIVSYKTHCRSGIPEEASIVCFHGKPRPHEIVI